MARSIRIVCTISPRRGMVSQWRDRDVQAHRETSRALPAEAARADADGSPCVITELAAVKRTKGLASA
ncbi:MAG TPA: hypothetical protein VG370_13300 [Chloroflexota bacterium]|jgi:hypothetical protein|nr:hypothetical protein [Chloroflexota bacterium]